MKEGGWIVSARFDLALLALPAAATALALTLPAPAGPLPLVWFLLLVVAFDVAHVWATLYVSYLDGEAFARRRRLFLLPIPLALGASWALHERSPALFWSILAYVAIHHFASQQWGFVALYRLRGGERTDRGLDKLTLWTGALGPVLLWHASPERRFDWFGHGEEFLVALPPWVAPHIVAVMLVVGCAWVARQVWRFVEGSVVPGKVLWMIAAWLSWSLGIGLAEHPLVSLAAINLLHGIPFLGLVWFRCNRRWEGKPATSLVAWLSRPRMAWAFYGLIVALALLEEGLWDGAVWGVYLSGLAGLETPALASPARSLVVAALATPQIVHYALDAWLWKLDGSNPDLHEALGVPLRR
jgi:hypothetical protein